MFRALDTQERNFTLLFNSPPNFETNFSNVCEPNDGRRADRIRFSRQPSDSHSVPVLVGVVVAAAAASVAVRVDLVRVRLGLGLGLR